MRITNFEEATKQLQLHLQDYLEINKINTSKNFNCINPAHEDKKPSMGLIKPDNVRAFCHSCQTYCDIFDACAWLESKPLTGSGFVGETLPHLAKLFKVNLELSEITEEEQYRLDTYRAYRHAYEFITSWKDVPEDIKEEIKRRNWQKKETQLAALGVGFVNDTVAFRNHLKGLGFSATFLDDVDLGRKDIFAPGHMIFTCKDETGKPVGFAARDLTWSKDKNSPKYVNQKTTGVKCNIYQKGKRLYGLDTALKSNRQDAPIYLMEGYTDVISCQLNSFTNVVATCGTGLTDDHLFSLKENNCHNVVLCFDNDQPGQDRTEVLLDTKFSNHKDLSVAVFSLPSEKDPDEFISKHGIEEFKNIKPISAFQWRLYRFNEGTDVEEICKKMMPLILSEISRISQERMLTELSKFTGISLKTLSSELERLIDNKERSKDKERSNILNKMAHELLSRPTEAEVLLSEAQAKLYSLKVKYDEDNISEDSCLKFLQDMKSEEEKLPIDKIGMRLGADLIELEEALRGDWRDTLMVLGGRANVGKSAFLLKVGYEIANHLENNACVIYHTIDDSGAQLLPRLVCISEGSSELEINHVRNPNFYKSAEDIQQRREEGYSIISSLVRDGRFILKDASCGTSLSYAESLIRYYQAKYPDRQIVYILDNFHKLRDFEGLSGDERVRFKTMSNIIKNMAVRYHIPILCTMEYTKLPAGTRPGNENLAESVAMEYDANLIAHIFNGLHELGDRATADMYHTTVREGNQERRPILELSIGKNKITSFKSKLYFKFFPASSDFRSQPLDVALALQSQVLEETKRGKKKHSSVFDEN